MCGEKILFIWWIFWVVVSFWVLGGIVGGRGGDRGLEGIFCTVG